MFRKALGCGLVGVTAWAVLDACSSTVIHQFCRNQAVKYVQENSEVQKLLGAPIFPGPWYNDSLALSHGGHIADLKIRFDGVHSSSDIIIKAVRRTGSWGTIVYNIIGPAEWKVLTCDALFPESGAQVRRISLSHPINNNKHNTNQIKS